MAYAWHFEVVWQYKEAFASGLAATLALSAAAILLAFAFGTALGVARVFLPGKPGRDAIGAVVEVLRSMPKIVLMVWIFYAMPALSGVHLPAFESAVVAIAAISAGYVAEIVRGAIDAVPHGQVEAARVLGMGEFHIATSIVLPQAIMKSMPALMGECITNIKDSTLAVIIGVGELLHQVNGAAVLSYRPLELYTALGAMFLLIVVPLSLLSKRLEFKEVIKRKAKN